MANFYLPYHFVPVVKNSRKGDVDISGLRSGQNAAVTNLDGMRHDRYEAGTLSGVIECSVEAKSSMFIGDTKCPTNSEEMLGFKLDGRPALPASSLRGMISSVAEAASNSALRVLSRKVLGEDCYSFRKSMRAPLSAIGKLIETRGGWVLEPLCLPVLHYQNNRLAREMVKWRRVFPLPVFRSYIGDSAAHIRGERPYGAWTLRTGQRAKVGLVQLDWADVEELVPGGTARRYLKVRGTTVLAQTFEKNITKITDKACVIQDVIVRVLGCYDKDAEGNLLRQIPNTKKHELLLPYVKGRFRSIRVSANALERFHQLANQMTEASTGEASPRPYEPKDTRPGRISGDQLKVTSGDLVYFEVNSDGSEVTEFSYSSIWRGRVETLDHKAANAWTFFEAVDQNLTPLNPRRNSLTLAEKIFGFVEEDGGKELHNGLRWKGRVRFSHGISSGDVDEMALVPLKELSSPKLPSPALYFKRPGGTNQYISKSDLKPSTHWPQGRKTYLHQPTAITTDNAPWAQGEGETFVGARHVRIRPWAKGSEWRFSIRFDNLNRLEIGLLLYALQPTETFRHKLGMGKPLGLGSVALSINQVRMVNRLERYSAKGWESDRFEPEDFDWKSLRDAFRLGMNSEIRGALETLGDPCQVKANVSVSYPIVDPASSEGKLYQWFVANDERARLAMRDSASPAAIALQPVAKKLPNGTIQSTIDPLLILPAPSER